MCGPSELTQGLRPWNNHFQSSIVFFCFFLSEALRNINSTSFVSSSKRQIFRLLQFRKAWRVVLLIHLTGYDCTSVTGLLTVKPVICRVVCSFVFIWESSGREFFLSSVRLFALSPSLSLPLCVIKSSVWEATWRHPSPCCSSSFNEHFKLPEEPKWAVPNGNYS